MKTETAAAPTAYGGSPTGLAIFWLEILELAHGGDDDGISSRLQVLACRREDLEEIFGPGGAARHWSEYARAFASFTAEGARDIAKKIRERRYDDVEVQLMAPARFEAVDPVRTNLPVYAVRLKRSDETDGIRIDTFVFLDGAWRTALKVGRKPA